MASLGFVCTLIWLVIIVGYMAATGLPYQCLYCSGFAAIPLAAILGCVTAIIILAVTRRR
jgi:hypothetical protein